MINGFIYKITSNLTDRVYIGSTTKRPEERLRQHLNTYNCYLSGNYPYTTSFELIALGPVNIDIIQSITVDTKEQLHDHEALLIREEPNAVNRNIPNRTKVQYYQENREEIKIQKAQYRQENREQINAGANEKFKCQICSGKYTRAHKSQHLRSQKHRNAVGLQQHE
jgi:hypothetical protein